MCNSTSSTCTCTRSYNDLVWATWTSSATITTYATRDTYNDIVWARWNTATTTTNIALVPRYRAVEAEGRARFQEQQRELAARLEAQMAEELAAKLKAEQLLLEHLDEKQQEEYKSIRAFNVVSADGQRTYRIREGWAGNVDLLSPEGKVIKRYCIHPDIACPVPDNMLAQKLLLETDEKAFIRIANASDPITGRRVA